VVCLGPERLDLISLPKGSWQRGFQIEGPADNSCRLESGTRVSREYYPSFPREPKGYFDTFLMDPTLSVILAILGLVMALSGLIACIVPIIPGPPLAYASLFVLSIARDWEPFSVTFLVVMGAFTVLVLILDYAVPAAGAKKYGATKFGVWGSILGMLIGLFVFPPFGLFIGGFAGAMAGELYAGKGGDDAFRAGLGVFIGSLVGIGIKMGFCGVILFFYLKTML